VSSFARPKVAISLGDPGGIGPEVIVKALADPALRKQAHFRILGAQAPLDAAAQAAGIEPFWWRVSAQSPAAETAGVHDVVLLDYEPGGVVHAPRVTKACGELSFRFIDDAIAQAKLPVSHPLHADAIVTGPINKAAWAKAGHKQFPGHTELLADRFGVKHFGMMFHAAGERGSPQMPHDLNVILATAHIPLMEVRNVLTIGRVSDTIDLGSDACKRLGIRNPRIAVCGLNPHAGDGGALGDEEKKIIVPALARCRRRGWNVSGPIPADAIFHQHLAGTYDAVVAMYHDQGLAPMKMLSFDSGVNLTLGLPILRTSPDHGTAFDLAGKNRASPSSTRAALDWAARLAAKPNPWA